MAETIDAALVDLIKDVTKDVVPFVERNAQRDAEIAALREAWLGLAALLHMQGDIDGMRFAGAMQECRLNQPRKTEELHKLASLLRAYITDPPKPQLGVIQGGKE